MLRRRIIIKKIKKTSILLLAFTVLIVSNMNIGASSLNVQDTNNQKTDTIYNYDKIEVKIDVKAREEVIIHNKKNTDAYDYPVRGGSEEWASLDSHPDMVEACQIPESILSDMSTAGLVITVLNYPLFWDIYFFNTPEKGLQVITSRFNGLQELMKREDAGVELLAIYRTMEPTAIKESWTNWQKGAYANTIRNIELLLSHKDIINSFNEEQLKDLAIEAMKKYRSKVKLNQSNANLRSSISIIEQAIDSSMMTYSHATKTYNSVKTPMGTTVDTWTWKEEMSQQSIDDRLEYVATYYPEVSILRNPTQMYNCHSYAWHNQSPSNDKWMQDPTAYRKTVVMIM